MTKNLPIVVRLERLSIPEPNSGCWLWLGQTREGYGRMKMGGRSGWFATAHRLSYEEYVGPIPDGLVLDHLCRNKRCINPDHLEPVTNDENLKRSPDYYGYRTHCSNGHEYSADTVSIRIKRSGQTERQCIPCRDDRARKQRESALPLDDPDDRRHGTWTGYSLHRCRCDRCKAEGAAKWARWVERKKRERLTTQAAPAAPERRWHQEIPR